MIFSYQSARLRILLFLIACLAQTNSTYTSWNSLKHFLLEQTNRVKNYWASPKKIKRGTGDALVIGNDLFTVHGTSGAIKISSGTHDAPSLQFKASPTTGIYYYDSLTRKDDSGFTVESNGTFYTNYGPAITFTTNNKFAVAYNNNGAIYIGLYNAVYELETIITDASSENDANANSGIALSYDATNNYLIVAWIKNDGTVYIRRYNIPSGWLSEDAINVSETVPASTAGYRPSIAVSGDGIVGIFWSSGTGGRVYANTVSADGTPGTPTMLSGDTSTTGSPNAIFAGLNTTLVCWNQSNTLYYNTFNLTDQTKDTPASVSGASTLFANSEGSVGAAGDGTLMFVYKRAIDNKLCFLMFDNVVNRQVLKSETVVTDSTTIGTKPSVVGNGTHFVIGWADSTNNIFYIKNYTNAGATVDNAYPTLPLTATNVINSTAIPAITLSGGHCIASWFAYSASTSSAVNGQAFSLAGWGLSTDGARTLHMTDQGMDVYGSLNITGGDLSTTGNIYCSGISSTSDERIKENIKSLNKNDCLACIKKLQPVSYNLKQEFRTQNTLAKKEIGLIAQHVEQIIPEIVGCARIKDRSDAPHKLKTIAYDRLTAYLIGALQAQEARIKKLEERA